MQGARFQFSLQVRVLVEGERENLQLISPDVTEQTLTGAELLAKNGGFFPGL